MTDEITFLDLTVLMKITPNTPLEKLGSLINASIFDASNIAGGLKQKGLIEFTAFYPGPNSMTITDAGKALILEADSRSMEPSDKLDESILQTLSGGKRTLPDLQTALNIRPKDLALRLYKENKQALLTYELKNGGLDLMLTESGFLHAKGASPAQKPAAAPGTVTPAQAAAMQQGPTQTRAPMPATSPPVGMPQAGAMPAPGQPAAVAKPPVPPAKKGGRRTIIIFVVLIVILALVALGHYMLQIY